MSVLEKADVDLDRLIAWIQSTGIRDPLARLRGRGIDAAKTFRTILTVWRRDMPETSNRVPTFDELIQCDLPPVARNVFLIAPIAGGRSERVNDIQAPLA